jgi:hypothetical protein
MRWAAAAPRCHAPEVSVSASSNRCCRSAFHSGQQLLRMLMKAVISRTSSVSGMTTPAILSAAVVDMCNSWSQRVIGFVRPVFWRRHGDTRVGFAERDEAKHDKGLLRSAVVDCLHQPKVLLNTLAEKFIRWDGRGTLPILTADELGPWTPVRLPPSGPTRAAHIEWKEHFEIEYREMLHRLAQLT